VRRPAATSAQVEVLTATEPDNLNALLTVDPLELEVGFGLVGLVDGPGSSLLNRITLIRRQIATELGLLMPIVRIHDNAELPPNGYRFQLRGATVGSGEVRADRLLALNPGTVAAPVEGIETTEPAFGLPALWITRSDRDTAELRGYTVVDPTSVVSTHFTETVRTFAHLVLSRQDTKGLLDNLKAEHPAVVDEVVNSPLGVPGVHRVLQNLLREGVSIRDLVTILETLGGYGKVTSDADVLTEFVRQSLGRSLCARYVDEQGQLHALILEAGLQEMIMAGLRNQENHLALELDSLLGTQLIQALAQAMEDVAARGFNPVLVAPSALRLPLRRYLEALPRLAVLSFGEVPQGCTLRNERVVAL